MENCPDFFARYDGPLPRARERTITRECREMLLRGLLHAVRLKRRAGHTALAELAASINELHRPLTKMDEQNEGQRNRQ